MEMRDLSDPLSFLRRSYCIASLQIDHTSDLTLIRPIVACKYDARYTSGRRDRKWIKVVSHATT